MNFKKIKSRSFIIGLIALASLAVILAVNILLSYFSPIKKIYLDMTKEGFYTLTDAMKRETKFINELGEDKDIEIIFCTDPDYLEGSQITRVPYFMSLQLQNEYENVKVKTVNSSLDPTALAQYKRTSLASISASDIIISYGDRYRITNAAELWTTASTGEYFSYDGEYIMVTLMRSVTAIEMPKAYFLTDHGETYYDADNPTSEMSVKCASLYEMLQNCGLSANKLAISSVSEIPDDCALLIINNPTVDFTVDSSQFGSHSYISDTEKINRYLIKNQGALIVAKDFETELPIFEEFLYDWGFEFGDGMILKDENSSLSGTDNSAIVAEYSKDEDTYAYGLYQEYADTSSSPRTVFTNTGYIKCSFKETFAMSENGAENTSRRYVSYLSTSETAKPYAKNPVSGEYTDLAGYEGKYDLAALMVREYCHPTDKTLEYSFILCANSADFLSNEILGNSYYANLDIVSAVTDNISRTDVFASTDLGGGSLNSISYQGKHVRYSYLSYDEQEVYSLDAKELVEYNYPISDGVITAIAIFVFVIPAAVAVLGIIVCIKRRFL